jgi:hypothetical protein
MVRSSRDVQQASDHADTIPLLTPEYQVSTAVSALWVNLARGWVTYEGCLATIPGAPYPNQWLGVSAHLAMLYFGG